MLPRFTFLKSSKGRSGTKVMSDRMPPSSSPALMVAARHAADLIGLAEKRQKWREPAEAGSVEKGRPDHEAAARSDDLRPSTCHADPPLWVASSRRHSLHVAATRLKSNVAHLMSARGRRDERRARRLLQH